MKILLLLLLFNLSSNIEQISNFDEVTYPEGISEYSYQYSNLTRQENRDSYFFFYFTYMKDIKLKIIDNDGFETDLENVDSSFWIAFNISSTKSQKYIFQITNNGKEPEKMIFIDNSQEINTNLDRFINLNFSINYIDNRVPLPLIFNIDTIQEDIFYDIEETVSYKKYGGDYILYFCELNDKSTCEFKGFNGFHFEKGKKYKTKMEWYSYYQNSYYFLSKIRFTPYYINEIELGENTYETNGKSIGRYFLLKVNHFKELFIYIEEGYGSPYGPETSSCTEEEKQLFPHEIRNRYFKSGKIGEFFSWTIYNKDDDYLIIKIVDRNSFYNNYIYIVNYKDEIGGGGSTLEYNKGTYGIIS